MVINKCICLQTHVDVQNKYFSTEILKDTRGESEGHYVQVLKPRDETGVSVARQKILTTLA